MTDNTRELRSFRIWAKKRGLDLQRDNMDRSAFMWSDTQLAWEVWQARAAVSDGQRSRERIAYG